MPAAQRKVHILAPLHPCLLLRPNLSGDAAETHEEFKSIAADMHVVTNDLMAGLGNTFSDFLGVALGTAALEIAKASSSPTQPPSV